jgi:caffeoyl-CoA O-methyltransferase
MTEPKSFLLTPELHAYLVAHATPPDPVLETLMAETAALGEIARMQIAPEQGPFLTLLARLLDARSIIEVGTFTGYSSICLARGLAPGGRLLCCDVNEEWTAIASRVWAEAGVDDRIELRLAPALETLGALPDDAGIDLAFVDADKGNYIAYYEQLVPRLRPGGLLVADNVLWSGAVVDPGADDDDTRAIRAFNDHAAADPRVEPVLLPVGDGLLLARRRP